MYICTSPIKIIDGKSNYYNYRNLWLERDDIDRPVIKKMTTGMIPTPRNGEFVPYS